MSPTYPAYVGLGTILIMIVMFLMAPWIAGKLGTHLRSFPESALACAGLVAAAAFLGHVAPRNTGEEEWFLAIFCILASGALLFNVVFMHTYWIKPLCNWSHPRAGITLVLGRLSMICLSAAVLFRSLQLHPVDLGRSTWNILELMAWLPGILTALPFLGLLVFAVVTHRREQKAAAAAAASKE